MDFSQIQHGKMKLNAKCRDTKCIILYTDVSGRRLRAGGRRVSNTGSSVQVDRQHNLLLHTTGRDVAYVRFDSQTVGEAATEYRRNCRLVLRMAGWPAGPTLGRLVYYQVHWPTTFAIPSFHDTRFNALRSYHVLFPF